MGRETAKNHNPSLSTINPLWIQKPIKRENKNNEKRKIEIQEIMLAYGHVEMEKKWISKCWKNMSAHGHVEMKVRMLQYYYCTDSA